MFGKPDKKAAHDKTVSSAQTRDDASGRETDRPPVPTPPPDPEPKPPPSALSTDLVVTGTIVTTGDLFVSGRVEGDITARHLSLAETGTVTGEITAEDLIVEGSVTGRIHAANVRLSTSARVEGEIRYQTLVIEDGARFEGNAVRQDSRKSPSHPPAADAARPEPTPVKQGPSKNDIAKTPKAPERS